MRVSCVLLLLGAFVGAQEEVGRPYWVTTPSGAGNALRAATRAVAAGNWTGCAQALQVIFDKHATAWAKTSRRDAYVGARQRAVELLATMPARVRTEYERLYGPGAERALRQALASSDRRALLEVVRKFEATRAGLRAVLALADSALLRSRPAEARLLLARLRRLHPEAAGTEPILRRRALAAAKDHAQGGPAPHGLETMVPVPRVDYLDDHAWPMLGGNATRTRRTQAPRFHAIRRHFEIDILQRPYDQPPPPSQSFRQRRLHTYRADWTDHWREYNPVQPVIARGYLVFCTGRQLQAVNLYTFDEQWRYPTETEAQTKGRTNLSTVFSPVVADGVVYAAIETPTEYRPQRLQQVPITYYLPSRRLVAVDLETGDVLWSHEDASLGSYEEREQLRKLTIVSAPLVRGDRLYAGAAVSEGTFHNRLLAIDRRTGKLLYDTRISQGQQELNLFGRQLHEAAGTPVAEAGGVLYYGTNQGVFAAVDALLGTPLWATAYDVVPIPSTYLWFEAPRRWPRYDNAPPLVTESMVATMPTDGTHMLVLDRASGRVLWKRRSVRDEDFGFEPRVLQGADDERIYVSGRGGVAALWLRDRDERHTAGSVAWLQRFVSEGDVGAGRGFLARGELWVPTYAAIYRYEPATGKILAPVHLREGRDEQTPVHLVAGDGVLVTAGREFLCARYDESEVVKLAKSRMRQHPDAVVSTLSAADIYLATGRVNRAVEIYKQARGFAAARGIHAAERRARQGLHRALLTRARDSMERDLERAVREFEAAFRAAPTQRTRLRARLLLDALLEARGSGEVSEWRLRNLRSIEREHGARTVDEVGRTVRGWALRQMALILVERTQTQRALAVLQKLVENDPDGPDGRHASSELRAILLREGRHHYAPYEKKAQRLFEAALRSGDLEALERGLLIYSNAESAADATLELARRRLRAGDPTSAAHALQRFLVERPGVKQVPQALLLMVRALHGRGSYGPAYSALQRLKRLHGEAIVTRADGARVPAEAVAAEWLGRDPYPTIAKSARRRDLQSDLVKRFEKTFRRGSFVDVPDLLGQRPPALRESVLLKIGRTLLVLDSRNGEEIYRIPFEEFDPRGPLVLVGGRLLAVTERHVYAFDATTGRALARERIPRGGRGLALLEHQGQVFLIFRQRGMRGRVGVAALHPDDATVIWTTIIPTGDSHERVNPRYTIGHGGRLLVFSERPVRLTVVNTTSGAIENRVSVDAAARRQLSVAPRLLPDGRVLVGLLTKNRTEGFAWQHTYEIHLLDPAQPKQRVEVWPPYTPPRDGESRYLHLLNVIGDHVVALDDAAGAAVIRLRDGKQVKWVPRLDLGDAGGRRAQLTANQALHDSLLLVTTRARGGAPARLSAFELPSLRPKYSIAVTGSGRETAEVIDADGVLGLILMPNAQQSTRSRIRLYDPLTARLLQEIVPERDMGWFTANVQNGILIISPDGHAAYGYGPK